METFKQFFESHLVMEMGKKRKKSVPVEEPKDKKMTISQLDFIKKKDRSRAIPVPPSKAFGKSKRDKNKAERKKGKLELKDL